MLVQVKCIIADKKMLKVMEALEPFALEPPVYEIYRPHNVGLTLKQPEVYAAKKPHGESVSASVIAYVKALKKGTILKTKELLNDPSLIEIGISKTNTFYPLSQLQEQKVIRRKKLGQYEVL